MIDLCQQFGLGRYRACRANDQGRALTASEAEVGVGEGLEQRAQCLETLLYVAFDQGEQLPGQIDLFHLDAGVLELGLLGQRVEGRQGQHIGAQALEKAVAPVHGQIGLTGANRLVGLYLHNQATAAAAHLDQVAGLQAQAPQFVRVQAERCLFDMAEQAGGGAGAAHAVPLIAQAAGIEGQGKAGVAFFLGCPIGVGMKPRAAVLGGKAAVAIQAFGALGSAGRERPLLGTLVIQNRVAEPRQVEVALGGQVFVLFEQRLWVVEVEQAGQAGAQQLFQTTGEITGDRPIRPRLCGCWHGAAHMADATLGVGHRTFLLAPAGGGQQQVGVVAGLGGEEGFLHHHERAGGQRFMHLVLVGQRLRRVGAGDPQGLDLADPHRFEQLDGGQAGAVRQGIDAPVQGDFGTVLRVGGIAMARQQVG